MEFNSNISDNIIVCEKEIAGYIDLLAGENPAEAERFCSLLLKENADKLSQNRAASGAYARCICRFLLHKKTKTRLTDIIEKNDGIRRAVFGQLNTYKYSLTFIMKRVFRLNNTELTAEILTLLKNNPFRDEQSKPYSDRWSIAFLITEVLNAPADYMGLQEESLTIIHSYLGEVADNEKKNN